MAALPAQVAHAQRASAGAAPRSCAASTPATITARAALARLPVTRKPELLERQKARARPAATRSAASRRSAGAAAPRRRARVFQSPGPIYEPEGTRADYWRMARALLAAGFRAGDLVHNSFSYHLTPAGSMMESGAHALGCTVFAGGVGNTELQLQAMAELQPHGYIGTPSFLKILLEKAAETGIVAAVADARRWSAARPFRRACATGCAERGIAGYQCYATADLGLIAYETAAREGLVLDEGVIVEIVRPGTGDPVPDGEVGEVVVTTLNPDYPLIRFGTGDLSAVLPGRCPTGRTNTRIHGWLGRADQTAKVRGMFVHPSQVAEIARRHPEVRRARLVVEGEMANDRMTLRVEARSAPGGPGRRASPRRSAT